MLNTTLLYRPWSSHLAKFASKKIRKHNKCFTLTKICSSNAIHIIDMSFNKSLGLFGTLLSRAELTIVSTRSSIDRTELVKSTKV